MNWRRGEFLSIDSGSIACFYLQPSRSPSSSRSWVTIQETLQDARSTVSLASPHPAGTLRTRQQATAPFHQPPGNGERKQINNRECPICVPVSHLPGANKQFCYSFLLHSARGSGLHRPGHLLQHRAPAGATMLLWLRGVRLSNDETPVGRSTLCRTEPRAT